MADKKSKPRKTVELFYDSRDASYWYRLNGNYVPLAKADMKLHLFALGFSEDKLIPTGQGLLREIDLPFFDAMNKRLIHFAGSLAGHRVGTFQDGAGRSYLVVDEARGVWDDLPKKVCEPEFFAAFVQELLPDDQSVRFCHWLTQALLALRRRDFRPGQVLVLAGPPQCGKSLLQDIITEVLGGRSANPFRYMMEITQFNKDLVSAEHWKIEDPASTTDIRARRMFGNNLKNCAFTRDFPVHPKGKDAVNLPVFRRITISVNDEPENLAVIPPLEGSINDKLMLMLCQPVKDAFAPFRGQAGTPNLPGVEFKNEGEMNRAAVWQKVLTEIPMIRAWLLKAFKSVPRTWRDDRCGVMAWHHPELESELCSLSPEHRMLQLIDYAFFADEPPHTALEDKKSFDLENELLKKAPTQTSAIGRHLNWCGTYLGRLHKASHGRISRRVKDGTTLWTIQPPSRKDN